MVPYIIILFALLFKFGFDFVWVLLDIGDTNQVILQFKQRLRGPKTGLQI